MAKLVAISTILLLSVLVLVADASFRTIINAVVEEENSNWGGGQQRQRCQQQIQQTRHQLRQCQQMISQGGRFDMDIIDGQQQQQRQCCQGLQSMNRQCRCEAVNQMVREMMQHQGRGRQESERMEEMMEKARNIPDMCNLEPRQCQIQTPTVMEEENSQRGERQQRCQQQFQQKRQQIRQCQQMISQGSRFEMDNVIIKYGGQQQHRQCCQGLQSMDRQCRCDAVNKMVQEMMQHHQGEGQQSERMEEMMEKARNLPEMCNLEPRQCQIQTPYY